MCIIVFTRVFYNDSEEWDFSDSTIYGLRKDANRIVIETSWDNIIRQIDNYCIIYIRSYLIMVDLTVAGETRKELRNKLKLFISKIENPEGIKGICHAGEDKDIEDVKDKLIEIVGKQHNEKINKILQAEYHTGDKNTIVQTCHSIKDLNKLIGNITKVYEKNKVVGGENRVSIINEFSKIKHSIMHLFLDLDIDYQGTLEIKEQFNEDKAKNYLKKILKNKGSKLNIRKKKFLKEINIIEHSPDAKNIDLNGLRNVTKKLEKTDMWKILNSKENIDYIFCSKYSFHGWYIELNDCLDKIRDLYFK